jgi:tetratricopeptide (TPR) repeat protein
MRRWSNVPALLVLLAVPLASRPAAAQAQNDAPAPVRLVKLEGTTSSSAARAALEAGIQSADNIYFERAVREFDKAMAADSSLGLARVLRAGYAPGLTTAQREVEMARGIAAAANAPAAELVTALAFRERFRGKATGSQALFRAASELMPEDARLAFWASAAGGPNAQAVPALQAFTKKYPDFAPAYNALAYGLSDAGDSEGALTAVREYVRLAPREPNPYDSYAELLQRVGRYDEAAAQYQRTIQVDSAFVEAYAGLAEARLLAGKRAEAAAAWRQAVAHTSDPEAKLGYMDQLATGELYAGNTKGAVAQFTDNARVAGQQGDKEGAALAHRRLAVIEGARGNRSAMDTHLRHAAEMDKAETPAQVAYTAVAKALAGDEDASQSAARRLSELALNSDDAGLQNNAHGVNALVAAQAGDVGKAQAEIAEAAANSNARLARVYLADALEKGGDAARARTLRDEVRKSGNVTFADALAQMRLKK